MKAEIKFYEINEEQARYAQSLWSFRDYVMGSKTEDYKKAVTAAYESAEQVPQEYREKALYYADMYARKYAENINARIRNDLTCPSVMICGPARFPTQKKEKQNARAGRLFEELEQIEKYLDRIEGLKHYQPRTENQGTDNGKNYDNAFFKVVQNEQENRLQLFFDGKPSEEIRTALKGNGYKWSPRNVCWQRQLTVNARISIQYIIRACESA